MDRRLKKQHGTNDDEGWKVWTDVFTSESTRGNEQA